MNDTTPNWLQLSATVGSDDTGAVEGALLSAGAVAVTLADARDDPVLEPAPGETPLWPSVTVTGLFPAQRDPLEVLAVLSTRLPAARWHIAGLEDRKWEREWLRDFRPMRFGERLWVVPTGMPAPAEGTIVRLDPGLAFGTGTHPTTALCLEWLDSLAEELPGTLIVDYGCGSGILAIAALRLGAARAVAVDNDPQALLAARDNAAANAVADRLAVCAPEDVDEALGRSPADFLVANILAGPLVALAPEFGRLVRPGGRVALSGILTGQETAVLEACHPDFETGQPVVRDGWVRIDGTKGNF